jgi:SAM-dependent methyltransferase
LSDNSQTAKHYSLQWGKALDFAGFVKANADAAKVMPARILPWDDLFARARARAKETDVSVYDAACGFGDIANRLLADPRPANLSYLGADIHDNVVDLDAPAGARFVKWDITAPLSESFDFVFCRAAMHHTSDPQATCKVLASQLKPGGTLAFSVYAKKAPTREACDDALRARIVPMENEEAFAVAGQFSELGKALQAVDGMVTIEHDLPILGIKAGSYGIQQFIYEHFIKCWFNPAFSREHCDLVNFDWYHPPFAYRYTLDEAHALAEDAGLTVVRTASISAQHYVEAEAR